MIEMNTNPDGGESPVPEGYDPDVMGDVASPEEFEAAQPWQKERFSRFARKNREIAQERDAERQERMALGARLAALEANINKPKEEAPQGLAGLPEEELRSWKAKALATQQAFMADPTNDELKAQFAAIKPEHLMAVDDELVERKARKLADATKAEINSTLAGKERQSTFEGKLVSKYGTDAIRKDSPLYRAALAEYGSILKEFDATNDPTGALTVLAFERAHRKNSGDSSRDGRALSENERRRLAIEGQGRREAQTGNQVAALLAKGDWKSRGKAVDLQIGEFLKNNFGS